MTYVPNPEIVRAVQFLAGRCDWAQTRDDIGFNASDTAFGHGLAELPARLWTEQIEAEAWGTLRKYSVQLLSAGIDWTTLPTPAVPVYGTERTTLLKEQRKGATRFIRLASASGQPVFELAFPYDRRLVELVKDKLPGRRWTGSAWVAPATPQVAKALVPFIGTEQFLPDDDAQAHLDTLCAQEDLPPPPPLRRITLDKTLLRLAFDYDPELVAAVKALNGRSYDGATRSWLVKPSDQNIIELAAWVADGTWSVSDEAGVVLDTAEARENRALINQAASVADDAIPIPGVVIPEGLAARGYQWAAARYLVANQRVIEADPIGSGKTIVAAIGALAVARPDDVIVCVVPATVKYNWQNELMRWCPQWHVTVLKGAKPEAQTLVAGAVNVLVINWDLLTLGPKGGTWADVLAELPIRLVVGDEAHRSKNSKAQRTVAFKKLCKGREYVWLLTGTPVVNQPKEYVGPLQIIGKLTDIFGNWDQYNRTYCGMYDETIRVSGGWKTVKKWGVPSQATMEELNRKLRAGGAYVRRERHQILPELPDTQRTVLTVEITNRAAYARAEADFLAYLRATQGLGAASRAQRAEDLTRVTLLRQLAAKGKLGAALDWCEEFLESGESLLVFARHKEIQQELYQALVKLGQAQGFDVVHIFGGDTARKRTDNVTRFQSDPRTRVAVLSLDAASEGITLTRAHTSLFVEVGWTPTQLEQAEGRANRFGQTAGKVDAVYLNGEHTIDQYQWEVLTDKAFMTTASITGLGEKAAEEAVAGSLVSRLLTESGVRVKSKAKTRQVTQTKGAA